MFWNRLPHCDDLFEKFLTPWYTPGKKPTLTRPDMYVISAFQEQTLDIDTIQYIEREEIELTKSNFNNYREAYMENFQHMVKFERLDIDVIDAIDRYFNPRIVKEVIRVSNPEDMNNYYLGFVTMLGLALGDLFVETGKFKWLYSYPDFHSIVVNPETGNGITVFDWAVKKFSSYGINDGLKAKFLKAVAIVDEDIQKQAVG